MILLRQFILEGELKYTATGPILPASLDHLESGGRHLTVLYIEDDPTWIRFVEGQLNPNGGDLFSVRSASSIAEATRILEKSESSEEIDTILLDLNLPDSREIQSFEAIARLACDIPIVILSGVQDPEIAIKLIEKGAQDFLLKDFVHTPEALSRSLFSAVERHRILRQRDELQTQLIQAEKLESLGRIAAGIAHEVKNPLAIIQMGIAYLKSEMASGENETLKKVCDSVQDASDRAVGIIGGMVDFSRDDSVRLDLCDIRKVVEQAMEFLNYEVQHAKTEVISELSEEVPRFPLDESKMQQAVMNLIRNSLQAMEEEEGNTIRIKVSSETVQAARGKAGLQRMLRDQDKGEVVTLEIRDQGPGIAEDRISQVFEPFFTTKEKGKGAGLGLSVVFHIVELHGGVIRVSNAKNPRGLITRMHFFSPPR